MKADAFVAMDKDMQMDRAVMGYLENAELMEAFSMTKDSEVLEALSQEIERRNWDGASTAKTGDCAEVVLRCPRCGFSGSINGFKRASIIIVGIVLLLFAIVPGVFYFVLLDGKVRCPRCRSLL